MIEEKSIIDVPSSLLSNFDCGEDKLNTYLNKYAKQNNKNGVGKTFVLVDDDIVKGFYTLSNAQIEFKELPKNLSSQLPHYPIPAIRIARLAVDCKYQKQKIGSLLLKNAFKRIVFASLQTGIVFIIVDAKENSKGFYEHFGFICVDEEKLIYVINIKTVIKAMNE